MLDHVFCTNITAYCQQNWYVWFAIFTDLFTLIKNILERFFAQMLKRRNDVSRMTFRLP